MIVWAGSGTLVAWWIEKINRFGQGLCFRANQTGVGWGGRLPLSDEKWFKWFFSPCTLSEYVAKVKPKVLFSQ